MPPIAIVLRLFGKKLQQRSRLALEDYSFLSEWFQHRILGIETIKYYKSEQLEVKKNARL
jgi:ABC-type transport system involved in cytochrome bd biosynthesis, ATPase and permease components